MAWNVRIILQHISRRVVGSVLSNISHSFFFPIMLLLERFYQLCKDAFGHCEHYWVNSDIESGICCVLYVPVYVFCVCVLLRNKKHAFCRNFKKLILPQIYLLIVIKNDVCQRFTEFERSETENNSVINVLTKLKGLHIPVYGDGGIFPSKGPLCQSQSSVNSRKFRPP